MASSFLQSELPISVFIETEQLIRSTFEKIICAATNRRDQLLVQLNDMRLDYLNREETRNKQVSELEKIIRQLNEINIEQNTIVQLHGDQIKNLEKEQLKLKTPTPVPVPGISSQGLESLLEQMRGFGNVEEVGGLYIRKINHVRAFGKEGSKKGELHLPTGLTLYRDESIYIADSWNGKIQIFSLVGKFLAEFGKEQLKYPHSVALTDKWVFVSDINLGAIFKFQRTNNKLVCQSADGELNFPCGVTVDPNGEVLVADSYNNKIAVLNSGLKLIRKFGKDKLKCPQDVRLNENRVFVADNNKTSNIHIFTKSGDLIRSFIKLDDGTGLINICFDMYNNIIVSDHENKSIQIFTMNGQLIHKTVCESNPRGIAVENSSNIIICACDDGVVYIY